jgi:AcrR family transcriptional regulator
VPKISAALALENRTELENAAVRCFVRCGYHGVTVRMIAEEADVSLGALYTYFPDKLTIFTGVLERLSRELVTDDNAFTRYLRESSFPDDIEAMGVAIADNVDRYRDYMKLMYVDVVEFDGTHIREVFSHLEPKFRAILGPRWKKRGKLGPRGDIDPAFAFIAVYMSLYQFFILTRLFGAEQSYGKRSDKQVVAQLASLFRNGLCK